MSTNIIIDNSQGGIESGGADVTLPVNPTVGGALVASSTSSYVTHLAAHTMRNRLINGAHMVSQRNGDRLIEPLEGVSSTLPTYTTDRWIATENTAVGRSVYFDGSGDYLSAPSNTAYDFGTGDFTFECWVYIAANASLDASNSRNAALATAYNNSNQGWEFLILGNSTTTGTGFGIENNAAGSFTQSLTFCSIPQLTWNHIAISRQSGTVRFYLNGIQQGSNQTYTASMNGSSAACLIGAYNLTNYSRFFNGHISNLRIVKGTALYTANFTPSTSPLLPVAGTSLLACASKDIRKDKSSNDFILTANGNAAISTQNPYGDGFSNYFDGSGDYLSVPASSAYNFGTGDFTIEFWYLRTGTNQSYARYVQSANGDVYVGWGISQNLDTQNQLLVALSSNGSSYDIFTGVAGTLTDLQWNHCALVRSGNNFRFYVNGVGSLIATSSLAIYFNAAHTPVIGGQSGTSRSLNGYISNLRIIKGTALYTSNFTPSQVPLTAIANTSLLTCASRRFEDKSSNNFTITPAGNVAVNSAAPFTNVQHGGTFLAGRSAGWSNYFDGSGDYLTLTGQAIGTDVFTCEAWVYLTALTGYQTIHDSRPTTVSSAGFTFQVTPTGTLEAYGGSSMATTSVALTTNTWTHIALVRSSGNACTIYINGVSRGTGTGASNFTATAIAIGKTPDNYYFNGYISNLRIIKGTALYTTNFTPSTLPLVAVPNTSLLTCASENFEDKSSNNFAITKNGDVTVRTMSPFSHMPTGFSRALQWSVTKPATATAAEHAHIQQRVEGSNIYDLAWGTAGAKAATLSFWVRSPVTGTYCVAVQNSARDRSYVAEYAVSAANTWEKKSVTIPGPTTGTWNTNTNEGLRVVWDLGSGTDFSGAAGSWLSANDTRTANQTNFVGTALASGVQSNDFMVTGAQFELGSAATPYESMPVNAEVSLCQRYYARLRSFSGNNYVGFGAGVVSAGSTTSGNLYMQFPQPMRIMPTIAQSNACMYDTSPKAVTTISIGNGSTTSARVNFVCSGGGLTASQAVIICGNNNSNAYVELNAEL
jgi:hypothetical protein